MARHGVVYSQLCNSIVQYLLSDMTFTSNLSFLLDGLDWLQERIMSTDLPLPPAATASSDIRIIVKVIVHEVIVRSDVRCIVTKFKLLLFVAIIWNMLIILLIIKMQIEIRMETSAANITTRIQLGNTSILVPSNKIRNMNSDIEIMDYNAPNSHSVVLK